MQGNFLRRMVFSSAVLLGVVASGLVAQPQGGTITGRVSAAGATAMPLETARVSVVGTNLGATTNRDGTYIIRGVPAGTVTLRAVRLGYAQGTQTVTVTAGGTASADFTLTESPFALEEVTVTSTGESRKLEVGNTVNTIAVGSLVEKAPVFSISQIITARAPGVTVLSSTGTTGGGSRVRIRGSNSVSLSNEPLFIIDGVRVESSPGSISVGVGGQGPSRLNDINPEDIEDIQILKGPSASAVYGTGGSNGVILITTKRGVAGKPRWNFYAEGGILQDKNKYPDNAWGGLSNGTTRCRLEDQSKGTCTVEQIKTFNTMLDTLTSPLTNGRRGQYGGSVSGGSETVRYFVSGEFENERNVLTMPAAEEKRILESSSRTELREREKYPNYLKRWSLRANTDFNLSPKARAGVNIGYVNSALWLPQNDNNVLGIHSSGLNGDGRGDSPVSTAWGFYRPGETFQRDTWQTIFRLTTQANAQYTPTTWLTMRGVAGLDQTQRVDQQLQRTNEGVPFATYRQGQAIENRRTINNYTVDLSATATFDLTSDISSKTTAGAQYTEFGFRGTNASGDIMPAGFTTVSAGAIKNAGETNTTTKSAGAFVEQVFGYQDKLFVTASGRFDRNSSTGISAKTIFYPKAAASWLTPLSGGPLSSLRLRGSYGEAGQQPSGAAALEYYVGVVTAIQGGTTPAVALANLGDPTLKAERSKEFEGGFDASLFSGKVGLEFTAYSKRTQDALIFVPTPVSAGFPSGQFRNLGETKNEGIEAVVNAEVLRSDNISFDFTLTGALLRNEMVDLGGQPTIFVNGVDQQIREGYPLGGYWSRPYTYADKNGDGIIAGAEITPGDSAEYVGNFMPTREAGLTLSLGLFKNALQITSTLDYRGGGYMYNLNEDFRCRSSQNCLALYDKSQPLEDQARIAALRFLTPLAAATRRGFMEKSDYMKWRELSVQYTAPSSLANLVGAERMTIGLTGRNLGTITNYSGIDPESNGQGEGNFAQREFLTLPQLRTFALRVNLTY